MGRTITVSPKTIDEIFVRLNTLTDEIKAIRAKLFEKEPLYGSDGWWNREIEEAEKEFKKGKGILFKSSQDAIKWLNS